MLRAHPDKEVVRSTKSPTVCQVTRGKGKYSTIQQVWILDDAYIKRVYSRYYYRYPTHTPILMVTLVADYSPEQKVLFCLIESVRVVFFTTLLKRSA